jgi:hypothetical protein
MIRWLPVLLALLTTTSAMAQFRTTITNRFGSTTGFGSVLYPGTGGPPQMRLPGMITDTSFAGRLGATVRGYPPYTGVRGGYGRGGGMRGGAFGGPVIVPVPVPMMMGGYGYGYDVPPPGYYQQPMPVQMQQPQQPPVVIINQGYRAEQMNPVVRRYDESELPETTRRYDAPVNPMPDPNEAREAARPARRAVADDKPTIYLIAFKDQTILPALAYWVEGDVLNYITTQGTPNRASLTLIDREFSRQLNRERQIEFSLP